MSVLNVLFLHALYGIPVGLASGALLGPIARSGVGWGGYGSFRRRAARLGHVSLVALPLLSGFYGVAAHLAGVRAPLLEVAAPLWVGASVALSLSLVLAAWRERLAAWLLPLPATGTLVAASLLGSVLLPGLEGLP